METSRTTFPLYEQDKQAIRAIREHYGVRSDAEAIRVALRETWRRITAQGESQPISEHSDSHSSPGLKDGGLLLGYGKESAIGKKTCISSLVLGITSYPRDRLDSLTISSG